MKKTLALALALLMAFSMFGVMAFAADEADPPITVTFMVDNEIYKVVKVNSNENISPYLDSYPAKQETDTTRYTFAGWKTEGDDNLYYNSTLPIPVLEAGEISKEIVYTAVFSEEDISGRQSFLNFIESLFARLNLLFEYFATIFNF